MSQKLAAKALGFLVDGVITDGIKKKNCLFHTRTSKFISVIFNRETGNHFYLSHTICLPYLSDSVVSCFEAGKSSPFSQ